MKILVVLTSHDQLGDTGEKTGFWLEEFAAPYYVMKDAGADVTLASPAGGQPPLDPKSRLPDFLTEATERFDADDDAQKQLAATHKLSDVNPSEFDAVFYPGGHGPLWDLTDNTDSIRLIEHFVATRKPVAAVCHAPAVLLNVKTPNRQLLVQDKKVTGFTNTEEEGVELTKVVPFLLEDALKACGAQFERTDDWSSYVVTDGLLVTGQNPMSSEATAEALLKLLK